jgi:hypothetical protein
MMASPSAGTTSPHDVVDESGEFVGVVQDPPPDQRIIRELVEPTVVTGPAPFQLDVYWVGVPCQPNAVIVFAGSLQALRIDITPRVARLAFRGPIDPSTVTTQLLPNMQPER